MKRVARIVLLLCVALALAGCGRKISYRYKLTISLNTPDGVKTASVVNEITMVQTIIKSEGTSDKLDGEALYLDLGPGRRPLIALINGNCAQTFCSYDFKNIRRNEQYWSYQDPFSMMVQLYGDEFADTWDDVFKEYASFAKGRPPLVLRPRDLPLLVTFANINDPKSVLLVKSHDLAATLGPGISWRSITLQPTHEALTRSIETKLPWLKKIKVGGTGSLNGEHPWGPAMPKYSLGNTLSYLDFETLGR